MLRPLPVAGGRQRTEFPMDGPIIAPATTASPTTLCGCERPRRTVTDYFLNACQRVDGELPASAGESVHGADGARVQFIAALANDAIGTAQYRASTCAALVAYSEVLCEAVTGRPVGEAMRLTPEQLIGRLPGVPSFRHERAAMTVHAWWSAVARALATAETIDAAHLQQAESVNRKARS